ncbi:MAG TPA: hypothetical protein VM778_04840 [Gemmatimonadota bacterium]|nr:hypothetical protein [Gemmatimonadota bacterium]
MTAVLIACLMAVGFAAFSGSERMSEGLHAELFAGGLAVDRSRPDPDRPALADPDMMPLGGARLGVRASESWEIGFEYAIGRVELRSREFDFVDPVDRWIQTLLVEGRHVRPAGPVELVVSVGAGAIRAEGVEAPSPVFGLAPATVREEDDGPYDPALTASLGLRREMGERFGVTFQLRDVIHMCGDKAFYCPDGRTLHHLQWTAGARIGL